MGDVVHISTARSDKILKAKEIARLLDVAFDVADEEVQSLKRSFLWEHMTGKVDLKPLLAAPFDLATSRRIRRDLEAMPIEDGKKACQSAYLRMARELGQRLHNTWTFRNGLPWITEPAERHARIMPCLERLAFVWLRLAHPEDRWLR